MRVRPRLASLEHTVGASAAFGHGPNNMEMPHVKYKDQDLRLHLADGRVVTSCAMFNTTGVVPGAYTCGLRNTLYEPGAGFQAAFPK